MFWGNIQSAVKPTDRPAIESKTGEYILIAQGSKNLVLLNERQAVEYAHTAIIEGQIQPILIKCLGGYDPFQ